jgi:hypothetical protein
MPESDHLRPRAESLRVARFFEIPLGPTLKIEFRVTAFEDVSLPSPHERPEWKCRGATRTETAEAAAKLSLNVHTMFPSAPSSVPATPDFALPLLDNRAPVVFVRREGSALTRGRVFHQKHAPGTGRPHPTDFYVEYPEDSGYFKELRVPAIHRALGQPTPGETPWSKEAVADLLANLPPHVALLALLDRARSA